MPGSHSTPALRPALMAGHFIGVECPEPVEGLLQYFGPHQSMPDLHPSIAAPESVRGFAFVYILQTADGAFYIGQTRDVAERLRKHGYGLGSKFTSDHTMPRLVFCEGPMFLDTAVRREAQLKRWTHAKKEALIKGDLERLRTLSQSRERPDR